MTKGKRGAATVQSHRAYLDMPPEGRPRWSISRRAAHRRRDWRLAAEAGLGTLLLLVVSFAAGYLS